MRSLQSDVALCALYRCCWGYPAMPRQTSTGEGIAACLPCIDFQLERQQHTELVCLTAELRRIGLAQLSFREDEDLSSTAFMRQGPTACVPLCSFGVVLWELACAEIPVGRDLKPIK